MSDSPSSEQGAHSREDFDEVSAGGVVVRRFEGEHRILLILDPYGKWGLPKGHLEGDEGPREAAEREVREETALEDVTVGPEVAVTTWTFRREGRSVRKVCTYYLMWSDAGEARPHLAEGITDLEWLPMADATERVDYDNTRDVIREASRMIRDEAPSPGAGVGR